MKEELLITTRLPRRMFCKLVKRLEKDRDVAAEEAERFKADESETGKKIFRSGINTVKDIDLILEALFEED